VAGLTGSPRSWRWRGSWAPFVSVNAETEDVVARVREVTDGGAEVVVDTTPYAPQSLNHAVGIAVRKGRVVIAGRKGLRTTRDFPADEVIYKELTLRGRVQHAGRRDVPRDRPHRVGDAFRSARCTRSRCRSSRRRTRSTPSL
jgi:NADPH:quinone reductase-like Zn-dependent oxidoreductase